jgi:YHS domain-containing protein
MFIKFNKTLVLIALISGLALSFTGCVKKAEPASIMSVEQVALEGYDPVAYFVSNEAYKADGSYTYSYEGLTWNFKTSDNLESFKADPAKYIPVFGGFCAYELADEELVYSKPEFWHIHNGQVYLFSRKSAQEKWFRDMDAMIVKAQAHWNALKNPSEED